MYLVVSHEQLDATFEQHTEDGRMMKVRNDLLSGKWGRVKRIDRWSCWNPRTMSIPMSIW